MTAHNYKRVGIHGVPRSGTSWIGEIFNSSPHVAYRFQPLFSYAHKDYLTEDSSREDIHAFFERLRICTDEFTNRTPERCAGTLPTFEKTDITHVIYKEVRYHNLLRNLLQTTSDVMLVAVIRNPLSVINSWLKAPREFRRDLGWREADEWRYAPKKNANRPEEYYGYEKWKAAAGVFLQLKERHPDRVLIQRYSDLLADPIAAAQRLYEFCEIEFGEETLEFLHQSRSRNDPNPYSVYRSTADDNHWRRQLAPDISEAIGADLAGSALRTYLD